MSQVRKTSGLVVAAALAEARQQRVCLWLAALRPSDLPPMPVKAPQRAMLFIRAQICVRLHLPILHW